MKNKTKKSGKRKRENKCLLNIFWKFDHEKREMLSVRVAHLL